MNPSYGEMFSPGTPVSSTNKTDRHDITKILLKVALNTITLTLTQRKRPGEHPLNCVLCRAEAN